MKLILAKNQIEIFSVVYIRKEVFIDEQLVSIEDELDHRDFKADHFLLENKKTYVGTARVYYQDNQATIGRVAVLKQFRKKGYASFMLKEIINILKNKDISVIHIGAQVQALGFYEKLGFSISGDMYLDANIEHYPMEMTL